MRNISLFLSAVVLQLSGCNEATPPRLGSPPSQATSPSAAPAQNAASPAPTNNSPAATDATSSSAKVPSTAESSNDDSIENETPELSRKKLVQKIADSQRKGMQKMQRKQTDAAYELFRVSGRSAEELVERFPDLNLQEQTLCANAFYNQACALALGGETQSALPALQRAIMAGWGDLD